MNKSIQLRRVAWPLNMRKSRTGTPHPEFGKQIELGESAIKVMRGKGGKSEYGELGRLGYIKESDFNTRNLSPYGLTLTDCMGFGKEVDTVSETRIAQLEAEKAELMAKLNAAAKPKRNTKTNTKKDDTGRDSTDEGATAGSGA
jgi:hypothetical protein